MKPRLAATVAPSAGSSGSRPAAWAMEMTTGTTMLAAAVLEVVSESTTATSTADTSIPRSAQDDDGADYGRETVGLG